MSVTWGEALLTFASYLVIAFVAYKIGYDFGWLKGMKNAGDIVGRHFNSKEEDQ